MKEKQKLIEFCLSFPSVYEDYPFHDDNWAVMRHRLTHKSFAFIYEKDGKVQANVKCHPDLIPLWRSTYPAVQPGYHMNKAHWNTLLLDGSIPSEDLKQMVADSYALTLPKNKKRPPQF